MQRMQRIFFGFKPPKETKDRFARASKECGCTMQQILVALMDDFSNGKLHVTLKIKAPVPGDGKDTAA